MAKSNAHKLRQIIGDHIQYGIESVLSKFARSQGLYLDKKGIRNTRTGNKVTWTDNKGNKHDLDFVLEKNGTDDKIGSPVAFIEVAWRSYTKHSRNKAQEIQGALIPLKETYDIYNPFIGVILAGEFTEGALQQLRSLGFAVIYFPYDSVIKSYASVGVDITFGEQTKESELGSKIRNLKKLSVDQTEKVFNKLFQINRRQINKYFQILKNAINRKIALISITPLYGESIQFQTLSKALTFLKSPQSSIISRNFIRYEIGIRFSNGDRIIGQFEKNIDAIRFLSFYK
jgi:hypothetical protein